MGDLTSVGPALRRRHRTRAVGLPARAGLALVALICMDRLALGDETSSQDSPDRAAAVAGAERSLAPGRFAMGLRVGDAVQLSFFERLDGEEDRWKGASNRQAVPRGFHQRTELAGEYVVQDDGTITLPMLGSFEVVGRAPGDLSALLAPSFEALVGRKGFVNVLSIKHQPIYVLGSVKNPGAFAFKDGMTALHAVALAGGLRQVQIEPWQGVESRREVERLQRALDRAKRLLSRTVVLRAERDGKPAARAELTGLVGARDARAFVGEEQAQRNLAHMSQASQEAALTTAANNARSDLAARAGRLGPLDESIKLRAERVRSVGQLVDKNVLSRAVLVQAQGELADAEARRQQALVEVEAAKQRLAEAERSLAKHKVEVGIEVNRAAATSERESAEALADGEGVLEVMRALTLAHGAGANEEVAYEIVRREDGRTLVLNASEIAELRPGDLVKVRSADAGPERQSSLGSATRIR